MTSAEKWSLFRRPLLGKVDPHPRLNPLFDNIQALAEFFIVFVAVYESSVKLRCELSNYIYAQCELRVKHLWNSRDGVRA